MTGVPLPERSGYRRLHPIAAIVTSAASVSRAHIEAFAKRMPVDDRLSIRRSPCSCNASSSLLWHSPRSLLSGADACRPAQAQPDFSIVVAGHVRRGDARRVQSQRVQDYAALRSRLEMGLPPLVVTTNADEIESFEHRLAERIRRRARIASRTVVHPARWKGR